MNVLTSMTSTRSSRERVSQINNGDLGSGVDMAVMDGLDENKVV